MRFLLLTLLTSWVAAAPNDKYIDLTYALNKDVVLWPGRKLSFFTEFQGEIPGVGWVASRGFCMSEHTSTHMDSPFHFNKEGWKMDMIPLENLLNVPGVCVDVTSKVNIFRNGRLETIANYVLTRDDLLEWEAINGQIPHGSLVLLKTGWASRWLNSDDYKGVPPEFRKNVTEDPNAPPTIDFEGGKHLNFPGYDVSAAKFLISERNVVGVGIDTLSIDPGNAVKFPAHVLFTKRNVYMLENVANLHLLPATGFRLFAVPFKVDAGTGSPTRLLALLDEVPNLATYPAAVAPNRLY